MKNKMTTQVLSVTSLFATLILMAGCGSKVAGSYSLTQSGLSSYSSSGACSIVTLSITENSNAVSANGSNSCFVENLTGTDLGNGTIQVTSMTIVPTGTSSGFGSYSTNCTYTGTLSVVNNVISGTLTSQGGYCGNQPITINGTKTN